MADAPKGPCTAARLLAGARSAVVTQDGRSVLVVARGTSALVSYRRDADSGLLTQQQCFENVDPQGADAIDEEDSEPPDLDAGCDAARALAEPDGVAVSADGRAVFTVSRGDYLAAFERERGSGRLSQFACAEEEQTYKSCTSGRGLPGANAVAASPDARSLYVTSSGDRLLVFAASVAIATARVTADRGATIRVALACPVARREGCRGVLATRGVLRGRAFRLAAGRTSRTTIRLPGRVAKQLRARGRARLTLVARESRRPFGAASRLVTVLRR